MPIETEFKSPIRPVAGGDALRDLMSLREQNNQAPAFAQIQRHQLPTGSGAVYGAQSSGNLKEDMRATAAAYGWTGPEWAAMDELINRESGWNPQAQNPTSTAWGLGQFLDMHWGPGKYLPNGRNSTDAQQIAAVARYVRDRYGSPSRAIQHHNRMNWY